MAGERRAAGGAGGPLESAPGGFVPEAERSVILAEVLGGVELGAWDRRVAGWLAGLDTATALTIASWIARSRGGPSVSCGCGAPRPDADISGSIIMSCLVIGVRCWEYAARVNAAADLVEAGVPAAEAARVLAGRFGLLGAAGPPLCRAGRGGRAGPGPRAAAVFTVKLPAGLAGRVREHARASGRTISAVVAQALEEFLARGHRNHPRR